MKKLLVLSIAMLLLGAGIASADVKMEGDYYVRGQWFDNHAGTATEDLNDSYGIYDQEMNIRMTFAMTPYTKVFTRLELRDESWGLSTNADEDDTDSANQENIYVERLWGQHTFMNHTTIKIGIQQTGSWATLFANNGTEAFRLAVIQPTKIGTISAYTEKDQPGATGSTETEALDADKDSYCVWMISKAGGVNLYPLVKYVDYEQADLQVLALLFGADGTFNNVMWKAEVNFQDFNYEDSAATADFSVYGIYVDAAVQLNAFKLGGFIAYSSYDDDVDKAFGMGEDFSTGTTLDPELPMLLGDDVFSMRTSANGGLEAGTLFALYGTYNLNEKTRISLFGGYYDSNVDRAGDAFDGGTAWEVNVTAGYQITPLLKYEVGAATAQVEYGNGTTDPDAAIELAHRLAFTF